jgi:hypothetical protein
MSYLLETLRDKPVASYLLNDATPFQDYSGYNRVATSTGSTSFEYPLVNGAENSRLAAGTAFIAFESPVFKQGGEDKNFTLEAAFILASSDGLEQQVIGNMSHLDGITVKDNTVSFTTKYLTAPDAVISHTLQFKQVVHAIAIHTKSKNSLWINGELAGEVTLSEEQQADQFLSTDGNLYFSNTDSTSTIMINGVNFYSTALSEEAILRHYQTFLDMPSVEDVVSSFDGDSFDLSMQAANPFLTTTWENEQDWTEGELSNVVIEEDLVVPTFSGDTSIAGYWLDTFDIDNGNFTSIEAVVILWQGKGVVVETSLDGTTWTAATSGFRLTNISTGFDPTDEVLQVRVSFPGGIVDDDSYLENITVSAMATQYSPPQAGRTLRYNGSTPRNDNPDHQLNSSSGVVVESSTSLHLSDDTSIEDAPVRTLQFLMRRRSGTAPTLSITGDTYRNGAVGTFPPTAERWSMMHVVAPADVTTEVVLTHALQVASLATYDRALSATEISDMHKILSGTFGLRVNDSSVIGIDESTIPVKIYAFDWSIVASG